MFGKNRGSFGPPSSNDEVYRPTENLLQLASAAALRDNNYEAVHLYLAAFESASSSDEKVHQSVIDGLHKAWDLSCQLKDRSLAEHVFEKMEPYLSSDEVAEHVEMLQRLALDKLEEFGFSREDLQDMADMVSEDFVGAIKDGSAPDAIFAQVLSIDKKQSSSGIVPWPHPSKTTEKDELDEEDSQPRNPEEFTYADLVGFNRAIEFMHKRGIGLRNDSDFMEFLATLSRRHGISALPSFETLLFRSFSREDANQFMMATAQELGVPGVRMYMEETPMGFPVLLVVTTTDFKMNPSRGGFNGPGLLMLEDIDLWGAPFSSDSEDFEGLPPYAQFSRGARDAIMFIRSAVENPDVTVMATCADDAYLDEFFIDLLGPLNTVDIDAPNEEERMSIWRDVFSLYPSLRVLGIDELTRLSANLSRYDIYVAAREAVDQAFRQSIELRSYVPVTRDNIYNKLAAFQPLDSREYSELEESAVESLRHDLEHVDDLLKGLE